MGIRVTFDVEGQDDPIVMDDASAPLPDSEITINGKRYQVLGVALAYWTEDPGATEATVRLRPLPDESDFFPPYRIR